MKSIIDSLRRPHPYVVDGYKKGFRDGVLTTLDALFWTHHPLPKDIADWAETVRAKVKADRD